MVVTAQNLFDQPGGENRILKEEREAAFIKG
jgi:hypothetical protein